jgi:hypothetical protein
MSGRCLLMIGKWTTAHKVSIDAPKQELLTQAGISRYGEPQKYRRSHDLSGFSCRALDDEQSNSHRGR